MGLRDVLLFFSVSERVSCEILLLPASRNGRRVLMVGAITGLLKSVDLEGLSGRKEAVGILKHG